MNNAIIDSNSIERLSDFIFLHHEDHGYIQSDVEGFHVFINKGFEIPFCVRWEGVNVYYVNNTCRALTFKQ